MFYYTIDHIIDKKLTASKHVVDSEKKVEYKENQFYSLVIICFKCTFIITTRSTFVITKRCSIRYTL